MSPRRPPTDRANAPRPPDERDRKGDIRMGRRWGKVRRRVLSRRPVCADPFRHHAEDHVVVPATQVHHIVALRDAPGLAHDAANLAPLCAACHARISAMERAGVPSAHLFDADSH